MKQTDEEIDSLIIGNPDARLRTERHKERGRCVYPQIGRTILEGEYVCEYRGKVLTKEEAKRRHEKLESKPIQHRRNL